MTNTHQEQIIEKNTIIENFNNGNLSSTGAMSPGLSSIATSNSEVNKYKLRVTLTGKFFLHIHTQETPITKILHFDKKIIR